MPPSKTRKTFCSSCRKKAITASLTLWSSHIQITLTFLSEFWSTATLVTPNHLTSSWKNTSSLGSFQNQPHEITITKASNPMVTLSSLKTAIKIPTTCLRSCQTTTGKPRAVTFQAHWLTKPKVWPWTGVPRPSRSQTLIVWCQTSSFFDRASFWRWWLLHFQRPLE